ncbi:unnamed protein product [Calypogeia fissa]
MDPKNSHYNDSPSSKFIDQKIPDIAAPPKLHRDDLYLTDSSFDLNEADIAAYAVMAIDDPRTLNKILSIRPKFSQ